MKITIIIFLTVTLSLKCFSQQQNSTFDIIDSTCLLNPQFDSINNISIFSEQLKLIIKGLSQEKPLLLKEMIEFEKTKNFPESSLGHYYSVSESIFPKIKKYKIGNPIRYRRIECPYLDGHAEYFFTKRTKKVMLVMFEWTEFKPKNVDLFTKDTTDPILVRKIFEVKYNYLIKKITDELGQKLTIDQEKDSGRRDTKWKSANGISVYLFMFDNYNEIQLAIYKE
ncbi:MAG TPA: hypothetical protein PK431_17480 [Chitinophagales bacterium]|nr:hypothetical protein [Chitinophagales bacterium]